MASETLVIDSVATTPGAGALTLTNPNAGIDLLTHDYPKPDRKQIFVQAFDVFGSGLVESSYAGRHITFTVRCYGTEAVMRARVRDLTKVVGAIADQNVGVLKRTLNNGDTITFDLKDADIDVPADWMFLQRNSVSCTVTLLAEPAGRGADVVYSTHTETTNPELIFTEVAPAGDLPALGKLEITDASGNDQGFMHWGMQPYPGTATTAALSYAGTSRLAYNGATALAVAGAVSGTLLYSNTLSSNYQAVMGMASAATALCTHVGDYSVWARVYAGTANQGEVNVAMEWGLGDLPTNSRSGSRRFPRVVGTVFSSAASIKPLTSASRPRRLARPRRTGVQRQTASPACWRRPNRPLSLAPGEALHASEAPATPR
jgi:hypothetical protein